MQIYVIFVKSRLIRKKIMKKVLLISLILVLSVSFAQKSSLKGILIHEKTKEPIPFANITLKKGFEQVSGTSSDFDGKFTINGIVPGTYRLVASSVGFLQNIQDTLIVRNDTINFVEIKMKESGVILDEFVVVDYKVPLIDKDKTQNNATVTSEEIAKFPSNGKKLEKFNDDIEIVNDYCNQITATEINDFNKWNLWKVLTHDEFKQYFNYWGINLKNRFVVEVINENHFPVIGIKVRLVKKNGEIVWESRTDNTGKAELWTSSITNKEENKLLIEIEKADGSVEIIKPKPFEKAVNKVKIAETCKSPEILDIAFMVDATGSMGDEIAFLKSDLVDILSSTQDLFPNMKINTGSVFYKCEGNDYVTKMHDLSSDLLGAIEFIKDQDANGGGDEVVELALDKSVNELSWNKDENSVKILFLVLDQQPLTNEKSLNILNDAIKNASKLGIRVVPIVASAETMGTSHSLEYLMRIIALATNGTSLFLTDHSGIGNKHATPKTDEYDVEYLNEAVKRIIYQYTYTVDCEKDFNEASEFDTTYIFPKKIVAHEIVDSTLSVEEMEKNVKFIDLTKGGANFNSEDTIAANIFDDMEKYPVGIKFYPNPTSGPLNIEIRGDVKHLYLFDIGGKVLLHEDIQGKTSTIINLHDWSRGIYFLKYQINEKWFSGKIVLSY